MDLSVDLDEVSDPVFRDVLPMQWPEREMVSVLEMPGLLIRELCLRPRTRRETFKALLTARKV